MLISSDIDQIILDRLVIFYDSIYVEREFRFYHTEVVSVDRCFKSKKDFIIIQRIHLIGS